MKEFVAEEKLDLPVVLGQGSQEGRLLVLIPKGELAACSKDHEKFLAILQKTAGEQSIPLEIQGKAE